jgi:NAD(P)-dependent dehydrogenase (short-subunit alcohol dehydrogenase family)
MEIAVVTGAAHRLGKMFSQHLARLGYGIVLHYHSSLDQVKNAEQDIVELGVPVRVVHADLRNEDDIKELFENIDRFCLDIGDNSNLKILVNSAAIMRKGDIASMPIDEFDETLNVNLRAPFLCAQAAYSRMQAGGLIINISDVAAQKNWISFPAYTISKVGLDSLTRVLAKSFAPKVRVNAIAPGLVLKSVDVAADDWDRLLDRVPLKRAAGEDELSSTLDYLINNEYITGQSIVVDGGYSL